MAEGSEQEGTERPRPRVVDKRVSSRTNDAPEQQDAPSAPSEAPEAPSSQPKEQGAAQPQDPVAGGEPAPAPEAPPDGERMWTPEQEAEAKRMLDAMTQTAALDWILNSAVTLANVAGVKLDTGDLPGAQLAIDALAGLVNGLGTRLGQAEQPLRQSLSQLQMAYAQTAAQPPTTE